MSHAPHPFFMKPCSFAAGAASLESLPDILYPEVAFIGRSNAGKSSLINALVGQKALAKTSQNPGATQQLNFFILGASDQRVWNEKAITLVDMPGYGFAKVSKAKKGEWDHLIKSYLCGRPSLKRTFVLIDARRGVMPVDDDFMKILDAAAAHFQIVLTKTDELPQKALDATIASTIAAAGRHVAAHPDIIHTSSLTKHGIRDLQEAIIPFIGTL